MQSQRLMNPYVPPYLNGLGDGANSQYVDNDFSPVFNIVLAGNQEILNAQQPLDNDADFIWRGITISSTGTFGVRFNDGQGYFLSDTYIGSFAFLAITGQASPYVIFPSMYFVSGSRIGIDVIDQSGSTNTMQMVFRGCKRYFSVSQ